MNATAIASSKSFGQLSNLLVRFLDQLPDASEVGKIQGLDLEDYARKLDKLVERAGDGEKIEMRRLTAFVDAIGMDRKVFESAAISINKAARSFREEVPGIDEMPAEALTKGILKGFSGEDMVVDFVSKRSKASAEGAKLVMMGGGIPDQWDGGGGPSECEIACSMGAAMAFGLSVAAGVERSSYCAGLAVLPIVAFICLIIVAVAFIIAAKIAESAYQECIANC